MHVYISMPRWKSYFSWGEQNFCNIFDPTPTWMETRELWIFVPPRQQDIHRLPLWNSAVRPRRLVEYRAHACHHRNRDAESKARLSSRAFLIGYWSIRRLEWAGKHGDSDPSNKNHVFQKIALHAPPCLYYCRPLKIQQLTPDGIAQPSDAFATKYDYLLIQQNLSILFTPYIKLNSARRWEKRRMYFTYPRHLCRQSHRLRLQDC